MMTEEQIEELIQLLDLQTQVEEGNDEFIFGNYLEFPSASQIDPDLLPDVLAILGVQLPLAEAVTASSLRWLQDLSSSIRPLVLKILGEPTVSVADTGEFLLTFPRLNVRLEEATELVDQLLPSATYEHDLPDSQRYWQPDPEDINRDPDDELLDLYRTQPVSLDRLIRELGSLRTSFDVALDQTVQKAILFACYSLVESFTRQRAVLNAPRFPESPEVEQLVLKLLRAEVQDAKKRSNVVAALEPEKSWDRHIPEWQLRNALAHDIGAVIIDTDEISFKDANGTTQKRGAGKLFDALLGYVKGSLG